MSGARPWPGARALASLDRVWAAASTLAFAARVPLLMRRPLPELARRLEASVRHGSSREEPLRVLARVDRLLAAGRPLVRSGCLVRGLTAYRELRSAGLPAVLCFGIGSPRGAPAGHCWIELGGEPLGERRDPRAAFRETYRIAGGVGAAG